MLPEKTKVKHSIIFPSFFIILIWLIKIYESLLDVRFSEFGILPRTIDGLIGILTAPLIHGDFSHLIANSGPFFVLSSMIFYFYRPVSYQVFFSAYFITGIFVWIGSRFSYHIGASGVVYAMASFLFVSGIIRGNMRLFAISMLIIFLYGGMVWGILPIEKGISWESHLYGLVTGVILAFHFKKYGPQKPVYDWQKEDDDEQDESEPIDNDSNSNISSTLNFPKFTRD
jgi:membrane associated rhomboid family serine protease